MFTSHLLPHSSQTGSFKAVRYPLLYLMSWNVNLTMKWSEVEVQLFVSDSLWPQTLYSAWILQAWILGWVAFPFSRDLPNPGIEPRSPTLWVESLPTEPQGKPDHTYPYIEQAMPHWWWGLDNLPRSSGPWRPGSALSLPTPCPIMSALPGVRRLPYFGISDSWLITPLLNLIHSDCIPGIRG